MNWMKMTLDELEEETVLYSMKKIVFTATWLSIQGDSK